MHFSIANIWQLHLLPMTCTGLLCLVSNIKSRSHTASWWMKSSGTRLEIFRVRYMMCKQTWSLREVDCQFEAKFRTLLIEKTLSTANFHFVTKIQRRSVLFKRNVASKASNFRSNFHLYFRREIARTNNDIRRISFALLLQNTVKKLTLHQNAFHMHIWSHSTRHDSLQGSNTLITNISQRMLIKLGQLERIKTESFCFILEQWLN